MQMKSILSLTLAVLIPLKVGNAAENNAYKDFKIKSTYKSIDMTKTWSVDQYIENIRKAMNGESLPLSSEYPRSANMFDNTAALLGFYFKGGWNKDSNKKNEYEKIRNSVENILNDSFIKREVDTGLVRLDSNTVKDQTQALSALLMSAISYGYIVNPSADHPQNYKDNKKPYYAFRLGQQAIRDAVLRSYTTYIMNLRSEIAYFYNTIDKYCPNVSSPPNNQMIELSGVNPEKDFDPLIAAASGGICSNCSAVVASVRLLSKQLSTHSNIECVRLMLKLTDMKIQLMNAELLLSILATNYANLNNQEKAMLR